MAAITVGRFSYDAESGTLTGPVEYLKEQGDALLARIKAGNSVVYNTGISLGHDPVKTILVALQTDFAGWLGNRQLLAGLR